METLDKKGGRKRGKRKREKVKSIPRWAIGTGNGKSPFPYFAINSIYKKLGGEKKENEHKKDRDSVVGKPDCNAFVQWCRFSKKGELLHAHWRDER